MTLPKVCLLIGTLWLAACAPSGPKGVDPDVLAQAVGDAVGDPGTCVILAERDSGKVLWRSAKPIVCARALPSCVSPARMTVEDLVDKAAKALIGSKLDDAALDAAAQACSEACKPIDDKRGTIKYRTKIAGVLLKRAAMIARDRANGIEHHNLSHGAH